MRIGVPKESKPGERRVAATPKTVEQIIKLGYDVSIESGAGVGASFDDAAYRAAGAEIVGDEVWAADLVLKINAPSPDEVQRLQSGQTLVSLLAPALDPDLVSALSARGVTALAMDAVPRISRAQSLDVLSSMANIGGYRAVIEAANEFGSFFTGQVTAAGKVPPGQGPGRRRRRGRAWPRSAPRAAWARSCAPSTPAPRWASRSSRWARSSCAIEVEDTGPSATGYAKEMGEDFNRKAAEMYAEQAKDVDIVITTALIPGRPAPRLLTEEMVASMKPGSVVVDMAAANGGNVAGSRPDERVVTDNGVVILGYTDLPGRLPTQASPAVRHQPGEPAQADDPGEGRPGRPRPRRRRPARHDRREAGRDPVAPAAGPGLGRTRGRRGDTAGTEPPKKKMAEARSSACSGPVRRSSC